MNEDEAKTKWCPLVRQLGTLRQPALPGSTDYVVASGSQNRGYSMGGPLDNCRCIASACMAWRWDGDSPAFHDAGPEDQLDYKSRKGFCGAFGRLN